MFRLRPTTLSLKSTDLSDLDTRLRIKRQNSSTVKVGAGFNRLPGVDRNTRSYDHYQDVAIDEGTREHVLDTPDAERAYADHSEADGRRFTDVTLLDLLKSTPHTNLIMDSDVSSQSTISTDFRASGVAIPQHANTCSDINSEELLPRSFQQLTIGRPPSLWTNTSSQPGRPVTISLPAPFSNTPRVRSNDSRTGASQNAGTTSLSPRTPQSVRGNNSSDMNNEELVSLHLSKTMPNITSIFLTANSSHAYGQQPSHDSLQLMSCIRRKMRLPSLGAEPQSQYRLKTPQSTLEHKACFICVPQP